MECPKCGLFNPISASRCDCGYNFENKNLEGANQNKFITENKERDDQIKKRFWKVLPLLIIFGIIYLFAGTGEKSTPQTGRIKSKKENSKPKKKDLSTMAVVHSRDFVKSELISPSTADFPFFDYKTWNLGDDTYVVKSHVDSQNRLGATIRNYWHCKARYNGGENADTTNWTLLNMEFTN